jgi:hypothetical protein
MLTRAWSRVLEKLEVIQLVKKFHASYGARMFTTTFTTGFPPQLFPVLGHYFL